jgi:hypothetical protein
MLSPLNKVLRVRFIKDLETNKITQNTAIAGQTVCIHFTEIGTTESLYLAGCILSSPENIPAIS